MYKLVAIAGATLFIATIGASGAQAQDGNVGKPAIVEIGAGGTKTLLECSSDQMPVMTEGPTVEVLNGKETHYDHGILKCVDITEKARNGDAGGSGSFSFTDNRKVQVVNCPKGTVPFILGSNRTGQPMTITRDPKKPLPTEYVAIAPVLVRCEETALWAMGPK